ncbi:MAG: lamin tail domain-containing protein [Nannocystaceae bacterium]
MGSDTGGSTVTDPDGSSSGEPMGSSDGNDSTGAGCSPPCDPMTTVCEAGECVAPGAPGPGELVISELMPNPDLVTDDDGEWLELTNVSAGPVDIEGCVLYDASTDEDFIDSGMPIVVPPGGAVVLAKTVDPALNGGIAGVPYAFGSSYSLVNTGDEIRLECAGAVVDQVVYLDTWPFGAGVAVQLDAGSLDATANDVAGSWCAAMAVYGVGDLGTPGQANAGC